MDYWPWMMKQWLSRAIFMVVVLKWLGGDVLIVEVKCSGGHEVVET